MPPSVNPLARLFDGADEVVEEIERRAAAAESAAVHHPDDAWAEAAAYHPTGLALTVSEVVDETATAKTLRLRASGGGPLPAFLAGQYISLTVRIGELVTSRAFSISSSPAERDHYDLTVRRLRGGLVSNHLLDTTAPGTEFTSDGPIGTFFHDPLFHGDDLVFLAGGSGVAPAMSMIRDVLDRGLNRRMTLVYGSKRADDVIFREELDRIARERPDVLTVHHVVSEPEPGWTGAVGPLDAALIDELAGPLNGRMTYLCGPPGRYARLVEQLRSLGQPRRRIRLEANSVALPPPADPHWPAEADPAGTVTVTVRGRSFEVPRGRPLLDSLEDNGLRPRASCRSGECALCRVKVCSGEVFHAEEARLRGSDRRFGYAHACVAYPLDDVELDF
ncbi:2Fe-2S iron-sulfur cluster-binding protein [Streptomyces sp. NPDC094448]|uniref:2Fe-2S iron-sulfur cluster-binding protein n=1 Tax=Streptomyces sp. NPDC094448 TaxID=3366063 RepID=UPI00380AE4AD